VHEKPFLTTNISTNKTFLGAKKIYYDFRTELLDLDKSYSIKDYNSSDPEQPYSEIISINDKVILKNDFKLI